MRHISWKNPVYHSDKSSRSKRFLAPSSSGRSAEQVIQKDSEDIAVPTGLFETNSWNFCDTWYQLSENCIKLYFICSPGCLLVGPKPAWHRFAEHAVLRFHLGFSSANHSGEVGGTGAHETPRAMCLMGWAMNRAFRWVWKSSATLGFDVESSENGPGFHRCRSRWPDVCGTLGIPVVFVPT